MTTPHDAPATTPPAGSRSPFADVPARDYVTDAVALVLLCVSLGLAWSFEDRASERVDVVLVSAVSVASLAVTYVVRARRGALGTALRLRAWLAVPYAVLVLVALAIDGVAAFDLRLSGPSLAGGLGPALAVGLAGAALAAAPRAAEAADPELAAVARRLAGAVLRGLLAAVLVVQLIALAALVTYVVRFYDRLVDGSAWVSLAAAVVTLALGTALAAGPLLATVRGSAPWRWVLVALAAATVAVLVANDSPVLSMLPGGGLGAGLVLVPAAGAVALTATVAATVRPVEPAVRHWCEVARAAWITIAVTAGALAVSAVLGLVEHALVGRALGLALAPGRLVGVLVLDTAIAVVAVVAWVLVGRSGIAARNTALWLTGAIVVLGSIVVAVHGGSRPGLTDAIVAYGLPLLAILALTVPDAVRAAYAQLLPRGSATYGPGGAAAAEQRRPHGFTAAQAADPATDLAVLAAIVEQAPELRPLVAANPSAYPDLLAWLAQLHDPAVDAALASRRG
jgi:hypothetical protein